MEEKIIIQSKTDKLNIWFLVAGIGAIIGGFFFAIWAYNENVYSYSSGWGDPGYSLTYYEYYTGRFFVILFGMLLLAVILFMANHILKNTDLIVTRDRICGKIGSFKSVDLPVDSISAIGKSLFKSIIVSSSSGKIAFCNIANRDLIYDELKTLLANRQNQSSNDELKKLKELLDSDIITQDEFNIKKKQILDL